MLHKTLNSTLRDREARIFRRQKGIHNNKKLFVLACMDERLPLEEVLGLGSGDAHVFRNAGGLVTDDAIRSAALTIHFFDTREIIVVNHTECGMLSATGEEVTNAVEQKLELNLSEVPLDPGLPTFKLNREDICGWWKMQTDIDRASVAQAEAFRQHPLIPNDVPVTSYIYEVETGNLRTQGRFTRNRQPLRSPTGRWGGALHAVPRAPRSRCVGSERTNSHSATSEDRCKSLSQTARP